MARRKNQPHGGHGWFVTFADLMGLLVSFFVMLVAFSNQDARKIQAVTGSLRDAFGVQPAARYSGIIEPDGLPTRPKIKHAAHIEPEQSSVTPTSNEHGSDLSRDQGFALAAASLRRALQNMPELAEASKHIVLEESKQGLDINIVDQDGRAMFPADSVEPYARTRDLIERIADLLREVPYRVSITGHTSHLQTASAHSDDAMWELSVARANAVRRLMEEGGYPTDKIAKVSGRADTDPLIPDDVFAAPNRRVTITLIHEAPPVPFDLQP